MSSCRYSDSGKHSTESENRTSHFGLVCVRFAFCILRFAFAFAFAFAFVFCILHLFTGGGVFISDVVAQVRRRLVLSFDENLLTDGAGPTNSNSNTTSNSNAITDSTTALISVSDNANANANTDANANATALTLRTTTPTLSSAPTVYRRMCKLVVACLASCPRKFVRLSELQQLIETACVGKSVAVGHAANDDDDDDDDGPGGKLGLGPGKTLENE